ncbi:MAG: amidohydrolase [Phycisphaerae bacterium]
MSLLNESRGIADALRAWRRHLHAHPELSGQERETAGFVARELRAMGYAPVEQVGGAHAVTATLDAGDGPVTALRADMDALPIQEETNLPFSSHNAGVMHACGHDAHTAMLLGSAKLLVGRREHLMRPVRFLFQPHEEKFPGGAPAMIQGGALGDVGAIFGLHIISVLPSGVVGTRVGPFMAAVNDLHIVVRGKGGHAAMPESTVDPILAAAQIIVALQSVVSRSIAMTDWAVVSVTRVDAGTADNVIPETATLRGTIRTFDEKVRTRVLSRVTQLAQSVGAAYGAAVEVNLSPGYPVLVNDEAATSRALRAARDLGLDERCIQTLPAQGGGEDFAYYGAHAPAAFVFLGAAKPGAPTFPHHHPRFDIDEDMLPVGAALLAQFALNEGQR